MNESNNETTYNNTNSGMEFINSNTISGGNISSPISPQMSQTSPTQGGSASSSSSVSSVASQAVAGAVMGFALGNNNISLEPSALSHRVNAITSKIKEFKDTKMEQTRNWRQFLGERQQYTIPAIKDTTSRIKENVVYFQSNYLILFIVFSCYFVITNPFYLLLLGLLLFISVYIHYINPNLTDIQKKIGYGIQAFLSLYFLLYAGSSIFWLIGATCTITLLHAAFHVPNSTDDSTIKFGGGV
ncbi:hypothetical protein DICPUDRAFT_33197 [Dictyostelium purpureum]|uniref:PRA1 family protein n=1 Tax=Dictyostelium purpureum TaxID=5786 RepID=F0ZKC9_DICPU|nr:uncharacterized protein DICPUDRAFT_33197 [Dictyostelium purpureum]EGC35568.1 hypothetical protein DICPUDRAFT_33197 [Dictyostelium purpureum]|eukprot:XP_003287871.1 hypothetical protein DICPUDRAFT_33197 [Dictyostelium purpureum]